VELALLIYRTQAYLSQTGVVVVVVVVVVV